MSENKIIEEWYDILPQKDIEKLTTEELKIELKNQIEINEKLRIEISDLRKKFIVTEREKNMLIRKKALFRFVPDNGLFITPILLDGGGNK